MNQSRPVSACAPREVMPRTLNRRKGAKVGARQKDYARKFAALGLLSPESLRRIFDAGPVPAAALTPRPHRCQPRAH
jgi:hypothetical protein